MKKKKCKVYISLPISGYDISERRNTAKAMENKLRKLGYDVFNPLENGLPTYASTNQHMKADIKALLECDAVIFMQGFNHSAGCHTELAVAMAIGLEVWFEETENVTL